MPCHTALLGSAEFTPCAEGSPSVRDGHFIVVATATPLLILSTRWAYTEGDRSARNPPKFERARNKLSMSQDIHCLHTRFEAQAAAAPESPALTYARDTISYGELNARANRLAHYLRRSGAGVGQRVGLCLDRNLDPVIAILAVLKTGAAYVPMDPIYPADRVRLIVEDAQCPIVLAHAEHRERFANGNATVVVLDGEERPWEQESQENLDTALSPSDLAYVIYTSGSTGKPKGALVTHWNVYRLFAEMQPDFGFRADDVWTLFHSYAFDFSVSEMWGALFFGGRIVMVPHLVSRSPEDFYQLLLDEGVTVLNQTPSAFKQLQHHDETMPLTTSQRLALRYVLVGGEYMALSSLAPWFARHGDEKPTLVHVYGITETTVFVTYRPLKAADSAPGTPSFIGREIRDLYLRVLDENRQQVAVGEVGELYVGGPGVCLGYLNRPELTAERFIPDPLDTSAFPPVLYKSGDLVRLFENDLEFIGRNDNQVQLRGFRVELGEIEAELSEAPGIRSAIIRLREDVPGDPRLVAYYLAQTPLPQDGLREHLLKTLPIYMIPSAFVHLDQFPLNNNGKIDNDALPAPSYESTEYVAPQPGAETDLADIWKNVLHAERVGATDNFFALGGHSLLATRILIHIRERFGVRLPLRALYDAPSVAELLPVIEAAAAEGSIAGDAALPRADRSGPLPISYAQEQMWILSQLQPGLWAYNIPLRIELHGRVRCEDLEQALARVIDRHESLRTVFTMEDGHPAARILPHVEVPITLKSLPGTPALERNKTLAREAMALAKLPMDLATGPLLRATLYEFSEDHFGLALVVHHAVFDGWSISVLLGDLADAWHAVVSGTSWAPPSLPYQYADYALWQREFTKSPAFDQDLAYWKKQLEGPLPVLEMPLDFPRPKVQTWDGARVRHTLDPKLFSRISDLAQQLNVTPFVVLLAGWQALLYRYTGQEDSVIGAALAGRDRLEWEALVGFFVNTVALRTRLGSDLAFQRLVERVQSATLSAQDHQEAPFERVVAEVQHDRDLARSPVFQSMIVLHNTPNYRTERPGLVMMAEELDNGGAKFELTLSMQPVEGRLDLDLEYNTALYKRETAQTLLARFEALLEDAASDPARAIGRLNLAPGISGGVMAETTAPATTPSTRADTCLHRVFEAQVERTPDAPAVTCEGTTLSYAELNSRANRLAQYLQSRGVGPEVLVGLCLDRSIDIVVSILAVLKAGGAYVPMDPVYPAERVRMIVEDAQCSVVIAHRAHSNRFSGGEAALIELNGIETPWESFPDSNPNSNTSASSLAYVIYTSGSTGKPKGALITHWNVFRLIKEMDPWFNLAENEVWTLFHSYAFDFSVWEIWGAYFHGGRVVVVPHLVSRSPEAFYQLLLDEKVTVLNQTPSAFKQLQRFDESVPLETARKLSLRYVIFGGETLDLPGLSGWFDRHGDKKPELINMYGITETTVFVTYRPVSIADTKPGTPNFIGIPIPDLTLHVLNENRQPVKTGEVGELFVGGDGVGLGYLRRPELSAERFIPDPLNPQSDIRNFYKTGDLVRLWENDLEFLGRNDMQVQLRGFRVELGEIEATLNAHEAVEGSVVRMREDVPGDQRLAAYYLAKSPVPVEDLREHLLKTLPAYMVPSNFVHMDVFPLNNNGKIDVGALPVPTGAAPGRELQEAPQTGAEIQIADLWKELLRIESAGRRDNFFASGGHSLLAIQLLTRVNQVFGSELALADFFEDPTIAGLAARLDPDQARACSSARRRLLEIKPGAGVPFFCVKGAGDVGGSYDSFAGALKDGQPFFGFPDLDFEDDDPATVEHLASKCVADMQRVWPKGPYYLGGYSFGGIVAFEMAKQLVAAGESVPLLVMLDSAVLEHHEVRRSLTAEYLRHFIQRIRVKLLNVSYTWKMYIGYFRDGTGLLIKRLFQGPDKRPGAPRLADYLAWINLDTSVQYYLIQAGLAKPSIAERRLRMVEDRLVRYSSKSMVASKLAMSRYKMTPVDVEVTLLRAKHNPWRSERRDPTYGWSQYARKGVRVVEVPGNHMVIIRHPYSIGLGKALQGVIDEVESRIE